MPDPSPLDVLCIGGANIDADYRIIGPTVLNTSNPAQASFAFGGVARNVAENLARIGCRVALASAVGSDSQGWELLDALGAVGIGIEHVRIVDGAITSRYAALHGSEGDFIIGVNSMALIDAITPEDLAGLPYDGVRWAFADTNLATETLGAVIARRRAGDFRLAIDAVAVPKVDRLPADLTGIDLLFANTDEASAILGLHEPETPEAGVRLARGLLAHGAGAASVSLGVAGAVVASADGTWHVGIAPAALQNTTGTGDARIAGTLLALLSDAPLPIAAQNGSLAAAVAAESTSAIDPSLTPQYFNAQSHRLDSVTVTRIES